MSNPMQCWPVPHSNNSDLPSLPAPPNNFYLHLLWISCCKAAKQHPIILYQVQVLLLLVHPGVDGVQPVVGVPGHGVWRRRRQPVDDWNIKHKITFTQSQPLTVSANKNSVVHRGNPKQEHHTTHHQHQAAVTTSCKHFYNLVVPLFTLAIF